MADGFAASGFFVLRTPLLPYSTFTELAGTAEEVRENLRALLSRADVREALFVASPSLSERLPVWLEAPRSEAGLKVERALVKYVQRMAARPTPFGLFAGCSSGVIGDADVLRVESATKRYTRLDMHYLCALADALSADPEVQRTLRFRPSSSLCGLPRRPRYVEGRIEGPERLRSLHLVGLAATSYLNETIERARAGATLDDLVDALVSPEVSRENALAYVLALVESQVLISELEPFVTGPEPLSALIDALSAVPSHRKVLSAVRDELAGIDANGVGTAPAKYAHIADQLATLPAPVELPRLYQVDLFRPAPRASLGPRTMAALEKAVSLLARVAPASAEDPALRSFREAFSARYEEREVPLLDALDDDVGVGFGASSELASEPSPILEGLDFPAPDAAPARFGKREEVLLRLLQRSPEVLDLREPDIEQLAKAGAGATLPDAFAAVATLGGDGTVLLHAVTGPSGALLFGRFCHGDELLLEQVRAHLVAEERLQPDAVFAEIVHLPQGRSGNILCRPRLRGYEIPWLGRSGAPSDRQLATSDLLVSVRSGRVVLRSRSLGKEVVPRLTTAHNFAAADAPLYRFLCSLQSQDGTGFNWDFGVLNALDALPRVQCGMVVLSPRRWRLREPELPGADDWLAWAKALRERLRLPRVVLFAEFDNRLPVDFDNPLSVEAFCQLAKGRKEAVLLESFPGAVIDSPDGVLAHELVVPFVKLRAPPTDDAPPRATSGSSPLAPSDGPPTSASRSSPDARSGAPLARSFPPGSRWLYWKAYTGVAAADEALVALAPVLKAQRFFFVRYSDPDFHLRIRVEGEPRRLLGEVLPALEAAIEPLRRDGRVWRTQLDTYEREIERYGGDRGIEVAERLFCADSQAALSLVELLHGEDAAEARWQLCLLAIDGLFDALGFDSEERLAILRGMRARFAAEFRVDPSFERQLDKRYRSAAKEIAALFAGKSFVDARAIVARRSDDVRPIGAELRRLQEGSLLALPVRNLAPSYVHMCANRLLRSAARAQELVLYDFLARFHQSALARAAR
ncbi:MAG TPA: lantibiotic dehydratase [Myxococcales bacterium]